MKIKNYIKRKYKAIIMLLLVCISATTFAQTDRIADLEKKLQALSFQVPALNEMVDVSVSGVSIQEFLRAVANNAKLNINVDPTLNIPIINNFSNVKVLDMLVFMAQEFDLEVNTIGNIISVSKYNAPVEVIKIIPKILNIKYDQAADYLSVDLNKDSLATVVKEITKKSGKNIILALSLGNNFVSGYIQNMPFDKTIEMLCFANDLVVTKSPDNFYSIDKKEPITTNNNNQNTNTKGNKGNKKNGDGESKIDIKTFGPDSISITAINAPIIDIIKQVSDLLKINYFLISQIDGNAELTVSGVGYDDLLGYLFNGTEYTYKKNRNIYLLGEKKVQELRESIILKLQYRTVDKISEILPADLKKDLEIKEFPDLNSLLITGPVTRINEIEKFIRNVDKVVPVVVIEVMIVDVTKKYIISAGINAGLGTNTPTQTTGTLYPSLDLNFSTSTINNLINSFNGFGTVNLGHVTPSFYLSIKALEENGLLKLRSTPKMATLNGHEATLSIGKTEYYMEEQNNVIGSQNPQNIVTRTYKPINADLAITIKPNVSGDEQVTLEIKVKQSDFTARISPDAPPGSVTRNFESVIRVKNQEMVLLGGLEESQDSNTGSGIPLLSRIPVLKWIFSSQTKQKSSNRLNIFIKPTIIY